MPRLAASSARARHALALVEELQGRFVAALTGVGGAAGVAPGFAPVEWLRDGGRHGGGTRFEAATTALLDRASVNVSQVHYDDEPARKLGSATALSTIVHPRNPRAPSVHVHVSWTELRDGKGYWRVMADLNPAIPVAADEERFAAALSIAAGERYEGARAQGDHYFRIPALDRHRGVSHFYLEGFATGDFDADLALARDVGAAALDTYARLLGEGHARPTSDADRAEQLAYHTVYLFQVLTLDRGTSAGLLVHDQNDVGILGSLPSHVDRALLASWRDRVPAPQDALVDRIVEALPDERPSPVTVDAKRALAAAVREHYRAHPVAEKLQASGDLLPPTVDNHR